MAHALKTVVTRTGSRFAPLYAAPVLAAAAGVGLGLAGGPSAALASTAITYETRALTGTDGPLGPGLGAGVRFS
ncbi:MAG: DUF488 domain-containing protein, partial [Phycisphaerae bacterium]